MSEVSKTPLLDRVNLPSDLKNLSPQQLRQLVDELRERIRAIVSDNLPDDATVLVVKKADGTR